MTFLLAITAGILFAAGLFLLMQRSLARLLIGLLLAGNGVNLAVFVAGAPLRSLPPLIASGASQAAPGVADPLPQALVLTAIVISFATVAFAAVLIWRAYETSGEDDVDVLRTTDT